MKAILEVDGLGLQAGSQWRVKDLSLSLYPGELVAVCGPNGAGKSTLLSLLAGEIQATKGQVYWQSKPLAEWGRATLARARARLEQQLQINFDFKVEEVVALGRFAWDEPEDDSKTIVHQALAAAGASELAGRAITRLSGGERQRVHLARVLAQVWGVQNALLLLDEPISAQDLGQQQSIFRNLKALAAEHHWSLVVVLHDLNMAGLYADRILMLEQGHLTCLGTPAEVLQLKELARVYAAELDAYRHPVTSGQAILLQA